MEVDLKLLSDQAWEKELGADDLRSPSLRKYVVLLIGAYSGPFYQRIVTVVDAMPITLLRMTCAQPSEGCELRKAVAKIIVDTPADQLEHNAKLLKLDYPEEMLDASVTGKLDVRPHRFLSAIRHTWKPTAQEQESENSMITKMSDVAPTLGIQLASDRCKIKKVIGDFEDMLTKNLAAIQAHSSAKSKI